MLRYKRYRNRDGVECVPRSLKTLAGSRGRGVDDRSRIYADADGRA